MMRNYYHLLIETRKENLSRFMKHINASYAIYFNKKYKRSGHLWQGRFKSWYVTDESYLYTLINYIENNPVKAKIVKNASEYQFSSYQSFIERVKPIECLKGSFVFQEFPDQKEREEFLQSTADERVLEEIKKASNLVIPSVKEKIFTLAKLKKMFKKVKNSSDRNTKIYQAYNEGFSQHAIAENLGLSQPYINRIVKQMR